MLNVAQVVEAVNAKEGEIPTAWRVRMIDVGMSKNGAYYSRPVLQRAVEAGLFEGVRAQARSDLDHVRNTNVSARNLAGWFRDTKMGEHGVEGIFEAEEPWVAEKLWRSWQKGKKDYFGFSIIGKVAQQVKRNASRVYRDIQDIRKIDFVDVVVNPSAGGGVIALAEADSPDAGRQELMTIEQLLKLIEKKAPEKYKELDLDNISEAEVLTIVEGLVSEGVVEPVAPAAAVVEPVVVPVAEAANVGPEIAKLITDATSGMMEQMARVRAEDMLTSFIAEAKLPKAASARIWGMMPKDKPWTPQLIAEAIDAERKYLLANRFEGPGSTHAASIVEGGLDELDKWNAGFAGFFSGISEHPNDDEKQTKIPRFASIREAYVGLTGDVHVSGQVCDATKVGMAAEAAISSGTWAGALGDHLHKAMQREYLHAPYNQFKAIADEVQYGNIQVVSLETIVNDDVGAVRRLPGKLARAAQRTLNTAAWYPILNNSDTSWETTTALFSAGHGGNITTSALSAPAISAARLVMMKQAEPQSAERLNIPPRWLAVPPDLEQQAFELSYSGGKPLLAGNNTNPSLGTPETSSVENAMIPNFYKTFNLEPLVIPHATDVNNWFMFADKMDIPIMEIGYLGGKDMPELFTQDMPNVGSMFTNDQLTYKIRFIFGIVMLDFRSSFGAFVV